jgi:hypothetical protein
VVGLVEEVDGVSDQDTSSIFEFTEVDVLDDLLTDVSIEGGNWVVHKVDLFVLVEGTGESNSSPLASRESHTSVTDELKVAFWLQTDISFQL